MILGLQTRKVVIPHEPEHWMVLRVPGMDFRGVPVGIDVVRVVDSGILPVINTGIAHREAGVGMIGAGLVAPPAGCFADALASFR